MFEDADSRAFYESLPELRELVPSVLLGGAAKKAAAKEGEQEQQQGEGGEVRSRRAACAALPMQWFVRVIGWLVGLLTSSSPLGGVGQLLASVLLGGK